MKEVIRQISTDTGFAILCTITKAVFAVVVPDFGQKRGASVMMFDVPRTHATPHAGPNIVVSDSKNVVVGVSANDVAGALVVILIAT